jgi:hypothetical protein
MSHNIGIKNICCEIDNEFSSKYNKNEINKTVCQDFIKYGKCSHIYSYNHNGINIKGYWHPFNNETIKTESNI